MAGEKTEQPTDKRLRDAREKGDIAKSTEVASAAVVLAVTAYFIAMAGDIFKTLSSTVSYVLTEAARLPFDEALRLMSSAVISAAVSIVLPIVAMALTAAFISLIWQTGFLIAPKSAIPKLENLNPARWFKNVFSKKNLFEFIKNILKVVVLSIAVYRACSGHMREIFMIPDGDMAALWSVCGWFMPWGLSACWRL